MPGWPLLPAPGTNSCRTANTRPPPSRNRSAVLRRCTPPPFLGNLYKGAGRGRERTSFHTRSFRFGWEMVSRWVRCQRSSWKITVKRLSSLGIEINWHAKNVNWDLTLSKFGNFIFALDLCVHFPFLKFKIVYNLNMNSLIFVAT